VGVGDGLETIGVLIVSESKDTIQQSFEKLFKKVGSDVDPAFQIDRKRMDQIMEAFEVSDTELRTFTHSDNLDDLQDALVRCVVSRVSMVGLDA
jgi:hypothetical protein